MWYVKGTVNKRNNKKQDIQWFNGIDDVWSNHKDEEKNLKIDINEDIPLQIKQFNYIKDFFYVRWKIRLKAIFFFKYKNNTIWRSVR